MNRQDLYDQKDDFYLETSTNMRGGIACGILLGIGVFVSGMLLGEYTRTWGSFLFNLLFFFALSVGGVSFSLMQELVGAIWARPIKRLHESLHSFLPISIVFFISFLLCIKFKLLNAEHVYPWIADHELVAHFYGKKTWLNENFMIIRNILALLLLFFLSRWHLNLTHKRDKEFMTLGPEKSLPMANTIGLKLRHWAAPLLFTYAFCFSIVSFDLTMSLAPTWFSTLWAAWLFSIMMQTLMAFLLLFMFSLKNTHLDRIIQRQQYHDIGKLMHGFTIFFAYLTYAHVLTYWYANVPEETSYFITRLKSPWIYFLLILPFFNFILPLFALIPKASKWTGPITIPLAIFILLSQWFSYMLIVQPEVVSAEGLYFPWIEAGIACGFLAIFLRQIMTFSKKHPMIAVSDPLLVKALSSAHP